MNGGSAEIKMELARRKWKNLFGLCIFSKQLCSHLSLRDKLEKICFVILANFSSLDIIFNTLKYYQH